MTLDQLHDDYVTALKRSSQLHRRWDDTVSVEPLQPGQKTPTVPPEQLALEREMREAWDDYIVKGDAYWAAVKAAQDESLDGDAAHINNSATVTPTDRHQQHRAS